jgi:hypothetical protein
VSIIIFGGIVASLPARLRPGDRGSLGSNVCRKHPLPAHRHSTIVGIVLINEDNGASGTPCKRVARPDVRRQHDVHPLKGELGGHDSVISPSASWSSLA